MPTIVVESRVQKKVSIDISIGTVNVADLLAGDIVISAQVEVTTAFDAAATLTLGFQGGTGIEVLNLGNTDMEKTDIYASGTNVELGSDDTLELIFNPSGATVGAAQLIVIIERE